MSSRENRSAARSGAGTRRRRRVAPSSKGFFAGMPITIRVGLPLIVLGIIGYYVREAWAARHAYVQVVDADGEPVTPATIELFAFQDGRGDPSPSERLGEVRLEDAGPISLGPDLVPGEALLRIEAEGYGVDYGFVELGDGVQLARVGPPREKSGRVVGPDGEGVAGARVVAFGGGRRGVPIVEARTDASGRFTLRGFSANLAYLLLRVYAEGHAVLDHEWETKAQEVDLLLRLQRTEPVVGRVTIPAGVEAPGLRVRAHSVPGVETAVLGDGSFRLDHLPPPPMTVSLLATPLPEGWTHRRTVARAGDAGVEIRIVAGARVAGVVVDAQTGQRVGFADVYHEHGPSGRELVRCDELGRYRIGAVPPGAVTLRADHVERWSEKDGSREARLRRGATVVSVEAGGERTGVTIRVR